MKDIGLTEMMTCQELVELITDYFEGALSPGDRLRFEVHLRMCRNCRTYLDQMRFTIRSLGGLTEDSFPSTRARSELLETFRRWKSN